MREISSKEYTEQVGDLIEGAICDSLFNIYNRLAGKYGFEKATFDEFWSYYCDGHIGDLRDNAIELFEELGMDIRPDGKEW